MRNRLWSTLALLVALVMLAACTAAPPADTDTTGGSDTTQAITETVESEAAAAAPDANSALPEPVDGMFNVAFVYVGPIGDGGWTYAHNQGREYLAEQMSDSVHTVYLESVPEGADAERVIRNLARDGFDAIFTTSFGYMDPTEIVAEEFPEVNFVHVSGLKSNDSNFANLFGAMEDMKYLAGMIAGARAAEDGSNRIGYIAPFPIAEVIRHANAAALGMRQTCPECEMDIRWIFTWFDPGLEQEAAQSLIEAGAGVVITGADTPGPVQVAADAGLYGIGYDSDNACSIAPDACLTTPYWNWGPQYVSLVQQMMDGSFAGGDIYLDADSGVLGLLGFMEGQEASTAVPEAVIPQVEEMLAQMLAGDMTRFDIFAGPINDNKGNEIVPAGASLSQSDLEGIGGDFATLLGREPCEICMTWLAEGIVPDAEIPSN